MKKNLRIKIGLLFSLSVLAVVGFQNCSKSKFSSLSTIGGENEKVVSATSYSSSSQLQTSTGQADDSQQNFTGKISGTCALNAQGLPFCWSRGFDQPLVASPLELPSGVKGFSTISSDFQVGTCAIDFDGVPYCWGSNYYGTLGIGTDARDSHMKIPARPNLPQGRYISISIGGLHACAVEAGGSAYCWGYNYDGQLGNGAKTDTNAPVRVLASAGVRFVSISTGGNSTSALDSNGIAYHWGSETDANPPHELGGRYGPSAIPIKVPFPAGVSRYTSLSKNGANTYAMDASGNIFYWGMSRKSVYKPCGITSCLNDIPDKLVLPAGVTKFTNMTAGGSGLYFGATGSDGNTYFNGSMQRTVFPEGALRMVAYSGNDLSTCAMDSNYSVYCLGPRSDLNPATGRVIFSIRTPVKVSNFN